MPLLMLLEALLLLPLLLRLLLLLLMLLLLLSQCRLWRHRSLLPSSLPCPASSLTPLFQLLQLLLRPVRWRRTRC